MFTKWTICIVFVTINGALIYEECPYPCECNIDTIICQNKALTELPENIDPEVRVLDFSYNNFVSIPSNISVFKKLEHLSFKHNRINALGFNSLQGLKELKELDLSENGFTLWSDIHSQVLETVPSLNLLDLSHNSLNGFPDLKSASLKRLRLTNCNITDLKNDFLSALPNITELQLGENEIRLILPEIKSTTLLKLNLTKCKINDFHLTTLINMPKLSHLYLAKNYKLKLFNSKSDSLTYLDLSDCNMESIPKNKLLKLLWINLKGNHIRRIEVGAFSNMSNITSINLESNAISEVHPRAFVNLKRVEEINLSYNTITNLDRYMFDTCLNLRTLNLSRNYIKELIPFHAERLSLLDMSECEIYYLKPNCLVDMPVINTLDLSKNIFTSLPSNMFSKSLRILDVSFCRISGLKNETFIGMPNLNTVNLIGNRLFEIRYTHLGHIRNVFLRDNAWRCDCTSIHFKELYEYLTNTINADVASLTCQSPENLEGLFWSNVCVNIWYTNVNATQEAWIYIITFIAAFSLLFCVTVWYRSSKKRERLEEQERERETATVRQRLFQMQQQEHELIASVETNAPDPRELERPPSYHEALSMSRAASATSIVSRKADNEETSTSTGNNSRKKPRSRRKRKKSKTSTSEEQTSSTQNIQSTNSNNEDSNAPVFMESDI